MGVCTRQLGSAAIMYRKIETPLSLFLVSVSLNTSTKDKSLPWRLAGPVGPVLLGREELCTQSMQSTQQGIHIATGALGAVG